MVILPDNDDPGRKHGQKVGRSLEGVAAEVRVLELPGLPKGGDVSDWIAGQERERNTRDEIWAELERLGQGAPEWKSPASAYFSPVAVERLPVVL